MIQGFYTASTGMKYRQRALDNVANNIANVNTEGYKANVSEFKETLYREFIKQTPDGEIDRYRIGTGTHITNIRKDLSQGRLINTNNQLDIGLIGEGFLSLQKPDGEIVFSRGGSFSFSLGENNEKYIADQNGNYLISSTGEKIVVPADVNSVEINLSGELNFEGQNGMIQIMKVDFPDVSELHYEGKGIYLITEQSGQPVQTDELEIRQGFIEMSNVDLGTQMVEMMKNQRLFSLNSKLIQTIDEMESMSNKLRR